MQKFRQISGEFAHFFPHKRLRGKVSVFFFFSRILFQTLSSQFGSAGCSSRSHDALHNCVFEMKPCAKETQRQGRFSKCVPAKHTQYRRFISVLNLLRMDDNIPRRLNGEFKNADVR